MPDAVFAFALDNMNFVAGTAPSIIQRPANAPVHVDVTDSAVTSSPYSIDYYDLPGYEGDGISQTLEGFQTIMLMSLVDNSNIALTDNSLPVVPPSLADFDVAGMSIFIATAPGVLTLGLELSIDALTVSIVPIPPGVRLLSSGLLGLTGVARRRKA